MAHNYALTWDPANNPSGPFTTDFATDQNPIASPWSEAGSKNTKVKVLSGVAQSTQSGGPFAPDDDSYAIITGYGPNVACTASLFKSADFVTAGQTEWEIILCVVEVVRTGHLEADGTTTIVDTYLIECNCAHDQGYSQIIQWVPGSIGSNPTFNVLASSPNISSQPAFANGDQFSASVSGSVVTVKYNGVTVNSVDLSTAIAGYASSQYASSSRKCGMSFFRSGTDAGHLGFAKKSGSANHAFTATVLP